jgi:hypothetical protein
MSRSDHSTHNRANVHARTDNCPCRKAGETTEDCPWRCDRPTQAQEATLSAIARKYRQLVRTRR